MISFLHLKVVSFRIVCVVCVAKHRVKKAVTSSQCGGFRYLCRLCACGLNDTPPHEIVERGARDE